MISNASSSAKPARLSPTLLWTCTGLLLVALATVARVMLSPVLGVQVPFITFFVPVCIIGVLAGRLPGIITTLASAACALYFVFPPFGSFVVEHSADRLALVLYLVGCALVVEVGESRLRMHGVLAMEVAERRRAQRALQEAHEEMEARVKARTAELEEANLQLREVDRLKSEFLSSMTHELRTPLNAILGFTELVMVRVAPDSDIHRHLEHVRGSGEQLLGLIDMMLDATRLEAGTIDVALEPFVLRQVVDTAVAAVKPSASRKSLEIRVDDAHKDLVITSDARRVEQVLHELLDNAVKFTEHGSVSVGVALLDGRVEIRVADTGRGIEPGMLPDAFKPFQQVASGSSSGYVAGTGLGLHVSRRIAALLGGDLAASSIPGQGSVFTLRLPVDAPQRQEQETLQATTSPVRSA